MFEVLQCGAVEKIVSCNIAVCLAPCRIFVESPKLSIPLRRTCSSAHCVHLPYDKVIRISVLARCFPERPILYLLNPMQLKVATTEDTDIVTESSGAHTTILRDVVSMVGNYSFRLHKQNVISVMEVIGKVLPQDLYTNRQYSCHMYASAA